MRLVRGISVGNRTRSERVGNRSSLLQRVVSGQWSERMVSVSGQRSAVRKIDHKLNEVSVFNSVIPQVPLAVGASCARDPHGGTHKQLPKYFMKPHTVCGTADDCLNCDFDRDSWDSCDLL